MRKKFLKNHTKNVVDKLVPECFLKSKLLISLDQQSKVLYRLFLLHVQVKGYRKILKLKCRPLAFILCKAFLKKQKEVWN